MKKKSRRRILAPAFSSYHGKVHIQDISTKPTIFGNKKVYTNSVCAGYAVVDESEAFNQESPKKR